MKSHIFGIIGCQHLHITTFIQEMLEHGYTCAGIYDRDDQALSQRVGKRYNIPIVDELESLSPDSIDIIGCAAVNSDKIDVIKWCEEHGKHIMLDKPAVVNRTGYEQLSDVIERGQIQIGLLLTERFHPFLRALKHIIEQGSLGHLVHIAMRKPHRLSPSARPTWFFDKARHGGLIHDLMIHDFDLIHWLTGRRILYSNGWVAKHILPEHPTFYDVGSLQLLLDGGLTAQLYADWHTPSASWTWGDGRIFVVGTNGTAELCLQGDPLVNQNLEPMLKVMTDDDPLHVHCPPSVTESITDDFLRRVNGAQALITHSDILMASHAAVEADERAIHIEGCGR